MNLPFYERIGFNRDAIVRVSVRLSFLSKALAMVGNETLANDLRDLAETLDQAEIDIAQAVSDKLSQSPTP